MSAKRCVSYGLALAMCAAMLLALTTGRTNATQAASEPALTMADVAGPNNPKMIGIWGGERTSQQWFLQNVRSGERVTLLEIGLDRFHALNGRYPDTWDELEQSGLYPVRPLDPLTGSRLTYASAPTGTEDFLDLAVVASANSWSVTGQHPWFPEGKWESYTWDLSKNSNLKTDIFSSLHEKYPNAVSMRGDMLAESFSAVLRDYEERRNEMPGSTEQLLDGLWTVEGKYPNNPTLAVSSPGVFVFGLDKVDEIAAAVWSDETGEIYSLSYVYSPWPEGGWVVPPSVQDLADRANKNQYGVEWGALPEDYLPPTILWTCSLTSGD